MINLALISYMCKLPEFVNEVWFDFFENREVSLNFLSFVDANDVLFLPHLNEQHHPLPLSSLRIRQTSLCFSRIFCAMLIPVPVSLRPLYLS